MVILREDNSIHCSGSVIAPKLVLSAGHCFAENSDNFIPKEKLRIVFGIDDLNTLDLPFIPKTIRNIKTVTAHPDYLWPKAYSDVVIAEVDEEVKFSATIYPLCLPDEHNAGG